MDRLPTQLDQITPAWLTAALSERSPGTRVAAVDIESVIWGTATKVFLRLGFETRPSGGPPESVCLKGGFNDDMRAVAGLGYQVESRFYADVAPSLGDSVPTCWYSGHSEAANQGLVIIDDLRAVDAVFGAPFSCPSVDVVASTLESMAGWHGRTWNRAGSGSVGWLTVGSRLFRPVAESFLDPDYWAEYMTRPQTSTFDDALRDRNRVGRAIHRLWQCDDQEALSVSHGDPHVGNTYSLGDGMLRFLDWQTTCLAPWSDDVAYFVAGALGVEERRKHETDLLSHYLRALIATGAPAPAFDDAWLAYRRHHLHGLMFALCPPEMQPAEVCTLMGDRYANAAIDHDTLACLGE